MYKNFLIIFSLVLGASIAAILTRVFCLIIAYFGQ